MRFAIIGLGRFGFRLAERLSSMGHEVIGIDRNRELVQSAMDKITLPIAMDAADEHALLEHGIEKVDAAVVSMGDNFQDAVLVTAVLKAIGVKRIVSRSTNARIAEVLRRIGASDVVNPEDEAADVWAQRLQSAKVLSQYDLDASHRIVEMRMPDGWAGKTLAQLTPRVTFSVNIVAIKRQTTGEDGEVHYQVALPEAGKPLEADDLLVVFGSIEQLNRLTSED